MSLLYLCIRSFRKIVSGPALYSDLNQLNFFPAELLQKSPVVRPKDSANPVNWRDCVDEQQATIQEELALKDQTVYSYQQISCLDSVIRYSVTQSFYKKYFKNKNISIYFPPFKCSLFILIILLRSFNRLLMAVVWSLFLFYFFTKIIQA